MFVLKRNEYTHTSLLYVSFCLKQEDEWLREGAAELKECVTKLHLAEERLHEGRFCLMYSCLPSKTVVRATVLIYIAPYISLKFFS